MRRPTIVLGWFLALTTGVGLPTAAAQQDSVVDTVAIELDVIQALQYVDSAQARFHDVRGTYASSLRTLLPYLPAVSSPEVTTLILVADDTSWSAAAVDARFPELRCGISAGGAIHPLGLRTLERRPGCRRPAGMPTIRSPVEETPPSLANCASRRPLVSVEKRGPVVTQFILDISGKPEVNGVRIVSTPDFSGAINALYLISQCRYHPAKVAGRPVRVLIRQPFNFR